MYSGGDSADAQSYTQWALNSKYSNDQVDWAALAQQWISMKEARPPVPEAAQNQPSQSSAKKTKEVNPEGGEAPMEVENEAEDNQPQWSEGTGSEDSWKWSNQQQWNWGNSWNSPSGSAQKAPLLPTPSGYTQYSANVESENANYGYNSSSYQSGYWTASGSAKVIKPHNKRYSKVNVPTTVATTAVIPPKVVNIDAAKRKQLPAWLREGLEKMQRDKQKHDQEREKDDDDEIDIKRKLFEKNALEILKDTVKEQELVKSKFDSGTEDSEEDIEGRSLTPEAPPAPQLHKLTQEDMMVTVRRTMTEILLKVTNREIFSICKEELERFEKRKKASDQRISAPSGANLSMTLGLGAYGRSDSENSDEETNDIDSDAELKESIRKKKTDFIKIERAIEDKLAAVEKKDAGPTDSRTNSPSNSDDDKDSQVDAKTSGRKTSYDSTQKTTKNPKRASRKSSSTDSRGSSKDRVKRSKYNHRRSMSSSSSSSEKYERSRSRSRSAARGYKPSSRSERKYSRESRSRRSKSRSRSRSTRWTSRRSRRGRSRSESRTRSRSYRRSRERSRSSRSTSRNRRSTSRSYSRKRRSNSRSRQRSRSSSYRRRRSRSYSSGRGKKSRRN